MDPDDLFDINKTLYWICAIALVVMMLDIAVWRP